MTPLLHFLGPLEPFLRDYGYLAAFLGVFFEAFGFPLPGESLVIASALLADQGDLHIVPLLGAIWVAAVMGDNLGYVIGLFGGRRLVLHHGARIGITEPRLSKVEGFFARFGPEVVLIARFIVPLRQLNGLTAGTLRMPWHRFLLYNAIGAALWTAVWGGGVYYLGQDATLLLTWVRRLGYGALATAGLAALALLAVHLWRRRRR